MEVTGNTNNTGNNNKIDLTNVREVHVYREDGSIKETFWFPISPPPPIVIEDSSDTETEDEEEEELQKKEEEEKEKAQEAEEEEQEEEADKEKTDEAEAEAEEEEEEEDEEEEEEPKRRRIGEPAPLRAVRCADNRSNNITPLNPAPSVSQEEPEPDNEVDPPLDTSTPLSPLPELDPSMDIVAFMEEHGM